MATEAVDLSADYARSGETREDDVFEVKISGGEAASREQRVSLGSYETEDSLRYRASSGAVTSEGGAGDSGSPGPDDFIDIQGADITGDALKQCEKFVLKPYRFFLKFLGWSQFHRDGDNRFWKVVRVALVTFWVLVIITTFITQIVSCFRRDQSSPGALVVVEIDGVLAEKSAITCSMHLISSFILTDLLLLASYLFGLVLFSRDETEYLSNLAERVFVKTVQAKTAAVNNKWLIAVMGLFLLFAMVWIALSFVVRILTAISISLFQTDTVILWNTTSSEKPDLLIYDASKNALLAFDLIGFLFFDMVYVTAVMNYAAQSEMCIYLMRAIRSLVLQKSFPEIDTAIKNIHECRQYLRVLNGKTATATALILFNLGSAGLLAVISLDRIEEDNSNSVYIATVAAVLNSVLWVGLVSFPFIQASRVTYACMELKSTGPEIRSRPLQYVNTPQIELDSFVNFTNAAKMRATMFGVPVYPWMVWGLGAASTFTILVLFQQGVYSFTVYL